MAMATYNGERFLREQIDSILGQSVSQKLELVVCDDMSADGTRQILSDRQAADPRVKVFFNEKRLGFLENFTRASGLCKGEWIALADQDDIWEPNKLQTLLDSVGQKDFACSNALLVDQNNQSLGYTMKESLGCHWIPSDSEALFKRLVFANIVQGATMIARAEFLKSCPPVPPEVKFHDYWFAFCACARGGFVYVDQCLVRYRQHGSNVTTNAKHSFGAEIATARVLKEGRQKIMQECDDQAAKCRALLQALNWNGAQKDFLQAAARYFEDSKNKSFGSFLFFAKNCEYICLDRNLFRNALRVAKRFAAMAWWRITKCSARWQRASLARGRP